MASQQLLEQLEQALNQSESFKLLPVEKQQELKKSFAAASDEQILKALDQVKVTHEEEKKNAMMRETQAQNAAEKAQNLKIEMVQINKEELQENKEKDAVQSSKEADTILASIGQKDKKRKKFLGIF